MELEKEKTLSRVYHFKKLEDKIAKQDKIIDLMAQWISDRCLYEDTDSNYCEITQDGCYEWNKDCKQCIKQYFEKKTEESE